MQPTKKRYFSKVPGATFIFPDGVTVMFTHGFYDFDPEKLPGKYIGNSKEDPRNGQDLAEVYFNEIETLVRNGNPMFFDQGTMPQALPQFPQNAKSEAEIAAAEQVLAKVNGVVTGDPNTAPSGGTSDVNSSAVDPNLKNIVFAAKVNPLVEAAKQRVNQQQ